MEVFLIYRRFISQKHRWIKKFVLHCNKCTVVLFYNFSAYKRQNLWNEVHKWKNLFYLNRLIVLLQTNLEEISQLSKVVWKREKPFYKVFAFLFLGFEIGGNRFSIRLSIRKSNSFCQKCSRGTRKSSQTWKSGLNFFWNILCDL